MPDGFGSRPGDYAYFNYTDPLWGCIECGAGYHKEDGRPETCIECGADAVTKV